MIPARFDITDVILQRGNRVLIEDLTAAFSAGHFVGLYGPNGSGKTSLLRALAGIAPPRQGTVTACGSDQREDPRGFAAHICYWAHQNALKAEQTVEQNLKTWARFFGASQSAVDGALDTVGLDFARTQHAYTLSAGQKRRFGLARLVVAKRPIWLVDEPQTALDAVGQSLFDHLLEHHLENGGMCIAALHTPLRRPVTHTLTLGATAT